MNGPILKEKIGFLYSGTATSLQRQYTSFNKGLQSIDATYRDGVAIQIVPRTAENKYGKTLSDLAEELIDEENVAVLVAAGGPICALAAQEATEDTETPVVFTSVANPIKSDLVKSLKRPGGNLTGIAGLTSELDEERLKLLHDLKATAVIGALINPKRPSPKVPDAPHQKKVLQDVATKMGLKDKIVFEEASAVDHIEPAITKLAKKAEALLVTADPFFNSERGTVIQAVADKFPAIYQWREFVEENGLMSYGPSLDEEYEQAGKYVGRILKGEKPAEMAVYQPTPDTFKLVINRATKERLKLAIPVTWLSRPDIVWIG
jgi:ABC-type uncharacterized transport system substrate-binding protein